MDIDISKGIRHVRKKLGLTQAQMAEVLGVSKETLSNYENNKTLPDIVTLCKMAYACDCSVDSILYYGNTHRLESDKLTDVIKQFRNMNIDDLPFMKKGGVLSIDSGNREDNFDEYVKNVIKKFNGEDDTIDISALNKEELSELIVNPPENLQADALRTKVRYYGNSIFARGLIEFTNYCKNNCYYCGIRCANKNIKRYRLTKEEIIECCKRGAKLGLSTFVLQGGEDLNFTTEEICDIVYSIKNLYPDKAITLSIGERSREEYKSYKSAGADRFLLRHETADDEHYKMLHPKKMKLSERKKCLYTLKELGYQTGAGFMVGSPYQTPETLAEDLLFLKELQPEMVGIGPFIPHSDTPFCEFQSGGIELTLTMLSLTRLLLEDVLLPATTALATLDGENGRKRGFMAGANVVMPNLTPKVYRENYNLYNNKISSDNEDAERIEHLSEEINSIGGILDMSRGDHYSFN